MFRYLIIILGLCCPFAAVIAQTGNRVSGGAEAVNFGVIDLSTPGGQSWSTDRTATPGYFSAKGIAAYTGAADNQANINGYVKHYADAADQAFTYPVGTGLDLRTLSISGTIPATAVIGTAWIKGDPAITSDPTAPNAGNHAVTSLGMGIKAVSPAGQWDWQDFNDNAAGVTVTVSIPDMIAFAPASQLCLVGWNGVQWVNLSVPQGAAAASGNTENSMLAGTMIAGITAIGIGSVKFNVRPDIDAGNSNKLIPGNVATNDLVPAGTTYGNPGAPASSPAGSTPVLTMNADGTYTFQTTVPGVYVYHVPVCAPAQTLPCPTAPLTITVTSPLTNMNPPITNNDQSQTLTGTPVTINVKGNDAAGNTGGLLGNPILTAPPAHGTATVNADGTVTYTPTGGYTGMDTFTYQVCETPGGLCQTAQSIVYVTPANTPNNTIANDDLSTGPQNQAQSGNVLANDTDPQGGNQDVSLIDLNGDGIPETVPAGTSQTVTQNGNTVGTITMNLLTGAFTFIPVASFTGTVIVAYQVTDEMGATDKATLVLVVNNGPDLTPTLAILPAQVIGNGSTLAVRATVREIQGVATNGTTYVLIPVSSHYTLNPYNPALTTINGLPVQNTDWSYEGVIGTNHIFKYGGTNNATVLNANTASRFGIYIVYNAGSGTGAENVGMTIFSGSGGERNFLNNSDYESVNYATPE